MFRVDGLIVSSAKIFASTFYNLLSNTFNPPFLSFIRITKTRNSSPVLETSFKSLPYIHVKDSNYFAVFFKKYLHSPGQSRIMFYMEAELLDPQGAELRPKFM